MIRFLLLFLFLGAGDAFGDECDTDARDAAQSALNECLKTTCNNDNNDPYSCTANPINCSNERTKLENANEDLRTCKNQLREDQRANRKDPKECSKAINEAKKEIAEARKNCAEFSRKANCFEIVRKCSQSQGRFRRSERRRGGKDCEKLKAGNFEQIKEAFDDAQDNVRQIEKDIVDLQNEGADRQQTFIDEAASLNQQIIGLQDGLRTVENELIEANLNAELTRQENADNFIDEINQLQTQLQVLASRELQAARAMQRDRRQALESCEVEARTKQVEVQNAIRQQKRSAQYTVRSLQDALRTSYVVDQCRHASKSQRKKSKRCRKLRANVQAENDFKRCQRARKTLNTLADSQDNYFTELEQIAIERINVQNQIASANRKLQTAIRRLDAEQAMAARRAAQAYETGLRNISTTQQELQARNQSLQQFLQQNQQSIQQKQQQQFQAEQLKNVAFFQLEFNKSQGAPKDETFEAFAEVLSFLDGGTLESLHTSQKIACCDSNGGPIKELEKNSKVDKICAQDEDEYAREVTEGGSGRR